ncbi:hypothetical protein HPB51_004285 [Rhipicephalus microplus]|uniref:Uncharacterized protein n=1 Tax=Rhipicephalus microplus TaxID=6941 RepID=A0A9J6ELP4_RHIMP|nr:hypothetical protein HPB51_004285 [Rhipicephalus microplus]
MILRNPFLLVIQVLLHVRAICASAFPCTETQPARYAAWSTYPPVYGIDTNSSSLRTTTPSLAAHRVPPSATSSTPTDIRRSARPVPTSGHDRGAESMILRNPFLLVIQVRDYRPELEYRSDDVCLVLLPCPRSLLLVLSAVYDCFVDLLPHCGDVESNPGPTEAMFQKILDEIRLLKESSGTATQRLSETCDKLSAIERKLDELSGTVTSYTTKVDKLQQQVDSLVYKIEDLENRSRRGNLIVYGIKEMKDEKVELLEQKVSNDILGEILKVKNVGIECVHREPGVAADLYFGSTPGRLDTARGGGRRSLAGGMSPTVGCIVHTFSAAGQECSRELGRWRRLRPAQLPALRRPRECWSQLEDVSALATVRRADGNIAVAGPLLR